jgi:UDP:flavonoid glycosyltransferase YjiC (YdhE family)
VATVTADDRFRTAARQLADEIAAMPGADAAAEFLQTMPGPAPPIS